MNHAAEADELSAALRRLGPEPTDPAPIIRTQRPFYGVSVKDLRHLAAHWRRAQRSASPDDVAVLCDLLWGTGIREEMVLAAVLHGATAVFRSAFERERIDRWAPLLDTWETTDQLGQSLVAPWIADALDDRLSLIGDLERSSNPWLRRLSLVCAARLGRVEDVPWEPIAATVLALAGDREASIPKAISWVLRSHLTYHTEQVLAFVDLHLDRLPAVAVRETRKKARTGTK